MRLRLPATLLAVLLATVPTGCANMPDSGPVREAEVASRVDADRASDINPAPPGVGDSPVEIAKGFLDAMTASPIRLDTAREFLTESAAEEWDPEAATITYALKLPPRERGSSVRIPLTDAQLLDRNGRYQGRLPPDRQQLDLRMVIEGGEYRITNPPDALVVPASWFAQRFRQASLYFFDRSGRILVPEPVFVPRGEQLATALIRGLLGGPSSERRRVTRSFLPGGLSLALSVPVSAQGVAQVSLVGESAPRSSRAVELMLAQLAWTLRQEPRIQALRVQIGDQVVQVPGGGTTYDVDDAVQYDPSGDRPSTSIYGLSDGKLGVLDDQGRMEPAAGPLGNRSLGLRSVTVNLDGTRAAGVGAGGSAVVVAPMTTAAEDQPGSVRRVVTGATDLLPPAWDFAGRLWLVDRTADGAEVRYVSEGRVRTITVPGVSGRRVTSFLVSRDGTRFVAVVRGRSGDQVRIGRIAVDDRGRLSRVTRTERLALGSDLSPRITDLAWTSPTTIALLTPAVAGEVFEVRTLRVDGSPPGADALSTTVAAPVSGLLGAPTDDLPTYGVTPNGLVDLASGSTSALREPASSLGYVG